MLVRAPPIMEWMLHKFGQKVFLPKTRVLGAYMVQVVCLFYSIQKTNNKVGIQRLQAIEKGANFKPDHPCHRIGRRKEAPKRGGGIQRQRSSSTLDFVCIKFNFSPTNEAFL
jgi:hypothetical protein